MHKFSFWDADSLACIPEPWMATFSKSIRWKHNAKHNSIWVNPDSLGIRALILSPGWGYLTVDVEVTGSIHFWASFGAVHNKTVF